MTRKFFESHEDLCTAKSSLRVLQMKYSIEDTEVFYQQSTKDQSKALLLSANVLDRYNSHSHRDYGQPIVPMGEGIVSVEQLFPQFFLVGNC